MASAQQRIADLQRKNDELQRKYVNSNNDLKRLQRRYDALDARQRADEQSFLYERDALRKDLAEADHLLQIERDNASLSEERLQHVQLVARKDAEINQELRDKVIESEQKARILQGISRLDTDGVPEHFKPLNPVNTKESRAKMAKDGIAIGTQICCGTTTSQQVLETFRNVQLPLTPQHISHIMHIMSKN